MNRRIFLPLLLAVLLLTFSAGSAWAASRTGRTVQADSTVESVTVVGDDLTVEEGAVVTGDAVVLNGDATIAGTVSGALVVVNGDLEIAPSGVISGDCVLVGGELTDDGGRGTACTTVSQLPPFVSALLEQVPEDVPAPPVAPQSGFGRTVGDVSSAVGSAAIMGILAFIVASLAPAQLRQVTYTVTDKAVASGAIGFLTLIAGPSLLLLLTILTAVTLLICIGVLGIPILLILGVGFLGGLLVGWIAVGNIVGEQLAQWLHLAKNRSFAMTTALGSAALSLVLGLLSVLPLGDLGANFASLLVLAVGLGAVVLTKFGTRPYPAYRADPVKTREVLQTLPEEPGQPAD